MNSSSNITGKSLDLAFNIAHTAATFNPLGNTHFKLLRKQGHAHS
jgi:hypothetical protein